MMMSDISLKEFKLSLKTESGDWTMTPAQLKPVPTLSFQ